MYKGKIQRRVFKYCPFEQVNGKNCRSAQRRLMMLYCLFALLCGDKHKQLPFFIRSTVKNFMNLTHSTAEVNSLLHRQVLLKKPPLLFNRVFKKMEC